MAGKTSGGLVSRLWLGKEKSEDYARSTLPTNRWELFWDIFKGRFSKLVIINLLTALFFIPLALLIFFRYVALANFGTMYPFSQSFGIGYMAPDSMIGYAENIVLQVNLVFYLFLPIVAVFAAVGVAGAAYVLRNMVWTEGVFVTNDFWKGLKENVKSMLVIALLYSLVFYFIIIAVSMCEQNIALGNGQKWLWIICEVLSYLMLFLFSVMTMHMITMTVTYDLKLRHLIKNAFVFTVGLPVHNLIMAALCFIPFVFYLFGGILSIIGIMVTLFIGISLVLLIWTDYSQWAFDRFLNDKVVGAKKNRGIYEKVQKNDAASIKQYREQLALAKHNSVNNRPIKPITDEELKIAELPTMFTRKDLEKLRESKQALYDDHARYVEEHKNDEEFKLSAEEQAIVDKSLDEKAKRIEKAKKELAKRNKKK